MDNSRFLSVFTWTYLNRYLFKIFLFNSAWKIYIFIPSLSFPLWSRPFYILSFISTAQPTFATCKSNISQHCWAQHVVCVWPPRCDVLGHVWCFGSSLKKVKFEPTTANMSQHVATWWRNAHNMLRPTMLRYAALPCCDCLAGALHQLTAVLKFKLINDKLLSYKRSAMKPDTSKIKDCSGQPACSLVSTIMKKVLYLVWWFSVDSLKCSLFTSKLWRYMIYRGWESQELHCYNLATGKLDWDVSFKQKCTFIPALLFLCTFWLKT